MVHGASWQIRADWKSSAENRPHPARPTARRTVPQYDPEWHRFLATLPELGVVPSHHLAVALRALEFIGEGAAEPHIELTDEDAVVFTWNDGRRYVHLSVEAAGTTKWFFDDGTEPQSGRCAFGEPLPRDLRRHLRGFRS